MSKNFCPLIRKECKENGCKFWIHITGENPQSGEVIDKYDCAVSWTPVLLLENARMNRATTAAVESSRNYTYKGLQDGFAKISKVMGENKKLLTNET